MNALLTSKGGGGEEWIVHSPTPELIVEILPFNPKLKGRANKRNTNRMIVGKSSPGGTMKKWDWKKASAPELWLVTGHLYLPTLVAWPKQEAASVGLSSMKQWDNINRGVRRPYQTVWATMKLWGRGWSVGPGSVERNLKGGSIGKSRKRQVQHWRPRLEWRSPSKVG